MDKNAPKAIGYIRVSTELQAADGISLDAQRESIEDYCHAHKLNLLTIYQDDHTGKTLHRKGFQAALEHIKQSGAMLVAVKLDRVTRNVGDLDYLLKTYFGDGKAFAMRLVQFPVDTSSSIGRLLLNIICSVAQWEREEICSRTQMGLNYLKRQGVYLGGAPYGKQYTEEPDADGRRVLMNDPTEQATIARICALFDAGQSLHKIVDGARLAREEYRSCARFRWRFRAVAKCLLAVGCRIDLDGNLTGCKDLDGQERVERWLCEGVAVPARDSNACRLGFGCRAAVASPGRLARRFERF